ncbi:MAG: von Willebrand factor type [Frankiales bacterium]|nr:von Willebrand factor type [Frankiales bacterium]
MTYYRYGEWRGGPDPLAPPYDIAAAVDSLGDAVLDGGSPRDAMTEMLRRGLEGRRGLDDLQAAVRRRQREARRRGQLDGTLQEVRRLLDTAVGQERAALFPEPTDDARFREEQLDALPSDAARAVRELSTYDWRSPTARATFEQINDLLRSEVLDAQFNGMKQALANQTPEQLARVREMMAALNDMLDADARGEHTQADFDAFMESYGEMFPGNPENLAELVDELARNAAAASRLMNSLRPEQRDELANLMNGAFGDSGLQSEMSRLSDSLRRARPDLDWSSGERMTGQEPLGYSDATSTLAELADLDELSQTLGQDYAGASLDDVDLDAVSRTLGREAVDDVAALRQLERELEAQGYVQRTRDGWELSPKAVRRIGATALRRVFAQLSSGRRGTHDVVDAGAAGELTGGSRPWVFGDEQPIDVVRSVRNAVLRGGSSAGVVTLEIDDFEVQETESRTSAAVCLLVDLSYSMALRGTWGTAKSTALALHALVTTKFPQDHITIIGFSDYARRLQPTELAGLSWDMVQGTNLQHALMIARHTLNKHPNSEPVVLVVTDGEPTAHLLPDGHAFFAWPTLPETAQLTNDEVEKLTRMGATINVFMLDDEPRLVRFVNRLAERNGGRVFAPSAERLGEYVVSDYLRARRGRRGRRAG